MTIFVSVNKWQISVMNYTIEKKLSIQVRKKTLKCKRPTTSSCPQ